MSIENGVATGLSKVACQSGATSGKTKAVAGPAGFAALLQGVGSESLAVPDAQPPSGADDAGRDLAADDARPPDADPALLAAALVQPGIESAAATTAAAQERMSLARVASARAQLPRGDTPRDVDAQNSDGKGAVPQAGEQGDQAAGAGLQPLLKQAALTQRLAQQRQQQAEAAGTQGATREQRGEDVAARLGWQLTERLGSPATHGPQIMLAAVAGESGLRPVDRRQEKTERGGTAADAMAWNAPLQPDVVRLDVPAAAPDAGLMTEMRVAEQVSYWAGRGGVQNAELQVDGLGEGPVKVSIALQGQEARVEFRADQVQTRQVLEDSMPHLRELLAREGLVLAGVSVGTSGSDGAAGRQPQEGRKGARDVTVAVPELSAVARPATRGAVLSGRSVDLFV